MSVVRKVLYVGEMWAGGTCAMRAEALRQLGYDVKTVSVIRRGRIPFAVRLWQKICNRLRRPLDLNGTNAAIRAASAAYDILWIDKGNVVSPATLARVRAMKHRPMIIGFSPDDVEQRHCTSATFSATVPFYDAFITTKSYNVKELCRLGCGCVVFTDNAYDPAIHRPVQVDEGVRQARAGCIAFIGYHEADRQRLITALAAAGLHVHVHGPGWAAVRRRLPRTVTIHPAVYGDAYAKTICSYAINLGFLRKCNRDVQTTRSVEIPACGGFLLAERTAEHERLFREGVEAAYFGDEEELVSKAAYYLAHPIERSVIAARGRERCLVGGYSYAHRLEEAMRQIHERTSTGLGPVPRSQ